MASLLEKSLCVCVCVCVVCGVCVCVCVCDEMKHESHSLLSNYHSMDLCAKSIINMLLMRSGLSLAAFSTQT